MAAKIAAAIVQMRFASMMSLLFGCRGENGQLGGLPATKFATHSSGPKRSIEASCSTDTALGSRAAQRRIEADP
jgi:hypothetical protein